MYVYEKSLRNRFWLQMTRELKTDLNKMAGVLKNPKYPTKYRIQYKAYAIMHQYK